MFSDFYTGAELTEEANGFIYGNCIDLNKVADKNVLFIIEDSDVGHGPTSTF